MQARRRNFPRFLFLAAAIAATANLALAHHGSRISYDLSKTVTVKGIVTEFSYENPHIYIKFDVKDESGNVAEWVVETDPPMMMSRRFGWTRHFIKPGDQVTVSLWPSKVGATRGFLARLVTADGRVTDHTEQPQQ